MAELHSSLATHPVDWEGPPPGNVSLAVSDTPAELLSKLAAYIATLGLGDVDPATAAAEEEPVAPARPELAEAAVATGTIRLYLVEEQQILREAYVSFFRAQPTIELLDSSSDSSDEALAAAAGSLRPDVMLVGLKTLQRATIAKLERIREACPEVGLVLLFAFYDIQGIKALREFSASASGGCGYLLKHTIDTADQLTQVVRTVAEGRVIVDPVVMEKLTRGREEQSSFLKELSPKALEVLGWLAKGYRNETIAEVLCRDVKTVERHINSIYNQLPTGDDDSSKHPRVQAALMYMRATGLLSTEQLIEA